MKTILAFLISKENICYETMLPAKKVVCFRCDGTGVHDHPSFSNGITSGEMDEDPDFAENYMRGDYDVICEKCKGERVILDIDFDALTEEQKNDLEKAEAQRFQDERELAFERRLSSF